MYCPSNESSGCRAKRGTFSLSRIPFWSPLVESVAQTEASHNDRWRPLEYFEALTTQPDFARFLTFQIVTVEQADCSGCALARSHVWLSIEIYLLPRKPYRRPFHPLVSLAVFLHQKLIDPA